MVTFLFCCTKCVSHFLSAFSQAVAFWGSWASSRDVPLSRFAGLFWLVCRQPGGSIFSAPSVVFTSVSKVCSFSVRLSTYHLLFSLFSLQWFSPRVNRIIPFGFGPVFSVKKTLQTVLFCAWDSCQLAALMIKIDSSEDTFLKLRKHFWGENKFLTGYFKNKAILRSQAYCSFN